MINLDSQAKTAIAESSLFFSSRGDEGAMSMKNTGWTFMSGGC